MCQCCAKKKVNLKTVKISSIWVIVRVSDCPQKRTPEKRLQIAELVSHDQYLYASKLSRLANKKGISSMKMLKTVLYGPHCSALRMFKVFLSVVLLNVICHCYTRVHTLTV